MDIGQFLKQLRYEPPEARRPLERRLQITRTDLAGNYEVSEVPEPRLSDYIKHIFPLVLGEPFDQLSFPDRRELADFLEGFIEAGNKVTEVGIAHIESAEDLRVSYALRTTSPFYTSPGGVARPEIKYFKPEVFRELLKEAPVNDGDSYIIITHTTPDGKDKIRGIKFTPHDFEAEAKRLLKAAIKVTDTFRKVQENY